MGGRRDDAFLQWQPMDADVEKASDDRAKSKHDRRPEVERHGSPILGIEDGLKHGRLETGGDARPTGQRQFDHQP